MKQYIVFFALFCVVESDSVKDSIEEVLSVCT